MSSLSTCRSAYSVHRQYSIVNCQLPTLAMTRLGTVSTSLGLQACRGGLALAYEIPAQQLIYLPMRAGLTYALWSGGQEETITENTLRYLKLRWFGFFFLLCLLLTWCAALFSSGLLCGPHGRRDVAESCQGRGYACAIQKQRLHISDGSQSALG